MRALEILVLLAAAALVAGLTAAGMAVRAQSRLWLREWVDQRLTGTDAGPGLLGRPRRLLAAEAAGVAAAIALAGAYLGADGSRGAAALVAWTVLFLLVLLVVGQLLPRVAARRWPAALAPTLVPLLRVTAWLTAPFVAAAGAAAHALSGGERQAPLTSAEAIEELLRAAEVEGIADPEEMEIISGVAEFGGKTLRDVMTPRIQLFAIDEATDPREAAREIAESGYSRVPVFRGSLDDVVGMVFVFDVFKARGEVMPPVRPVAFAPASMRCSAALFEMLRTQRHLTVVLDEYGGTAGIVTMEDLLEELVGEIRDEHDERMEPVAPIGSRPRAMVVDAALPLGEVAAHLGIELPGTAAASRTVGGVLTQRLGRIPEPGERFRIGALELTILESAPTRIGRVLAQRADGAVPVELPVPD